jgi:hypothetical protein
MTMPWTNTPPLAYLMEALRLQREMREQGVVLTRDQAHDLALASIGPPVRWLAQEPTLTEEGKEILDQIVTERERSHTPPGPTRGNSTSTKAASERDRKPERPRSGASSAASAPGQGRGRSRRRGRQQRAVRNVKMTPLERFLADDGEDDEWTPA